MMKHNTVEVAKIAAGHLAQRHHEEDFKLLWHSLRPLEREILRRIAAGESLSSLDALNTYATTLGVRRVSSGSVDYAINKLRRRHLVVSTGERGVHRLESARLAEWIAKS
jgi:hypothetical protein